MRRRGFLGALGGFAACPLCARAEDASYFNYDPNDPTHGPAHWGGTCATGTQQSPVELAVPSSYNADMPVWSMAINTTAGTVVDTGHTIQLNIASGTTPETQNWLILTPPPPAPPAPANARNMGPTTYQMLQYHFHAPSEHVMNGQAASMEVHFVSSKPGGGYAVLGVLLDAVPTIFGDTLAAIMTLIGRTRPAPAPFTAIDPRRLIPLQSTNQYYTYSGSLTTPSCDETVEWFVLRSHTQVSQAAVQAYQTMYPVSARPVQAINGRVVQRNWS